MSDHLSVDIGGRFLIDVVQRASLAPGDTIVGPVIVRELTERMKVMTDSSSARLSGVESV